MSAPVFAKDFVSIMRAMYLVPILFGGAYFLYALVMEPFYEISLSVADLASLTHSIFIIVGALIAALAGTQFHAEEVSGGHSAFLARLPIPKLRLRTEKLGAGLLALGALYAFALLVLYGFGLDVHLYLKPNTVGTLAGNLFLVIFSTYTFALAAGRFVVQPVAVLFIAFGAEIALWLMAGMVVGTDRPDFGAVMNALLLTALFCVAPVFFSRPVRSRTLGGSWQGNLVAARIGHELRANAMLHALALALLLGALAWTSMASGSDNAVMLINRAFIVTVLGILIIAALGTVAFTREERHGLDCCAYHHPISRSEIAATKFVAAIPTIVMVAAAIAVARDDFPFVTTLAFGVLLFAFGVQTAFAIRHATLIVIFGAITWSTMTTFPIIAWLTPTEHYMLFPGYVPGIDIYLAGTVPLSLLAAAAMVIAYRLAVSRQALGASDGERQRMAVSEYAVAAVIVALVTWTVTMTSGL